MIVVKRSVSLHEVASAYRWDVKYPVEVGWWPYTGYHFATSEVNISLSRDVRGELDFQVLRSRVSFAQGRVFPFVF